jgi:hypothetical protein
MQIYYQCNYIYVAILIWNSYDKNVQIQKLMELVEVLLRLEIFKRMQVIGNNFLNSVSWQWENGFTYGAHICRVALSQHDSL